MKFDLNTLAEAIEFAKTRRGDCTMLILYIAYRILQSEEVDKP